MSSPGSWRSGRYDGATSPGPGQRPPGTSAQAGRLPFGRSAERRAAPAADPTPESSRRTAAIARLSRSCRSQHSRSGATGPRLGRTAWRSRAGDSPSRGKRPRNAGTPAAGRRGPWPARRQSPAGRPPAPASLRPGSDPNRRCRRGHRAGYSPRRPRTTPRLPPRSPPASKPKLRIHPRSENECGNTRPPSHPQSRDGPLEDGIVTVEEKGTGQGSVISPCLSNVYLHYVFDLWAERWRRREATGDMIMVRYADDIVVGFQHETDALDRVGAMNAAD